MTTSASIARAPVLRLNDFLASIVVFLVALPLCMGIAIASGVPPALGLVSGVIGGLVVGSLAGSPLQVSGPAAGMAVLVYELVTKQGVAMLGVVVLIAGLAQFTAGALRLGQWFRAVSPSVIHGMLAGIGVLIFASQFHVMVDDKPGGEGLHNLLTIPEAIYKSVLPMNGTTHQAAAFVGVLAIVSIIVWDRFKPKSLRLVPAPLLAVLIGTAAAFFLQLPITRVIVPADLIAALNIPSVEGLMRAGTWEILSLGLIFAFVASAETLLCASAVDQMHSGPRTQYDKELRAQGVGNLLCGAVGALPMTGVIVRSSANVQAGATTRMSAILHGGWLLLAVAALPWLLAHIPTSVLAAILVYTGYKLVNLGQIKKIAKYGKMELAIYASTLIGVVAFDLLTGVLIGFAMATIKLVYVFSHLEARVVPVAGSNRIDVELEGSATFFSVPKFSGVLDALPAGSEVHLHIEDLDYMDHACLEVLSQWEKRHQAQGGILVLEWHTLAQRSSRRSARTLDLGRAGSDGAEPAGPIAEGAKS